MYEYKALVDTGLDLMFISMILVGFAQWRTVAVLFVILISAHDLIVTGLKLEGLLYYGSAALFDLAFIVATISLSDSKLLDSLCNICIASMVLNFAGWVLWFNYFSPMHYDIAFLCLYAYAIVVLLRKDFEHVGGYRVGRVGVGLRWHYLTGFNRSYSAEA